MFPYSELCNPQSAFKSPVADNLQTAFFPIYDSLSPLDLSRYLCGDMMTTRTVSAETINDADLVAGSLAGNRDAFGQIIVRYQSLVCSLAYSATGSLSQSEDLAQETFVAAWNQLAGLREPEKLRAWLCGIARNLIGKALRRQGREPSHAAEPLAAVDESPAPGPLPSDHLISQEETAILWRSLERIPEIYREPLVLFYREHQSIETVAVNLDLTEDAVKQRLSRGRKMLQEQVLAFVEGALARTNPGQAFTIAVLAALPITLATSAKATTLGVAAAKGGAMAKGTLLGSVAGVLFGPALGVLCGYFGMRTSLKNACTPRERAFVIRYSKILTAAVVIFTATLLLSGFLAGPLWKQHPVVFIALELTITLAYGIFVTVSTWRYGRAYARMRDEERQLHPESFGIETLPLVWEYRSRTTLFGLPLVHCRSGKLPGKKAEPAIGWIAFGEVAYGILFANGAVAVGGISLGGVSVGIISFGGFGFGLLAFGGLAVGGIALGGAAIGLIASGGIALGWHAAMGGVAAAHELALGGAALANHANDPVAREFSMRYRWLDFTQGTPRNVFYTVCFAPVFLQVLAWNWWRRKMQKRAARN
jgi:RNA polymerase sigma factor (sigma-70 family)